MVRLGVVFYACASHQERIAWLRGGKEKASEKQPHPGVKQNRKGGPPKSSLRIYGRRCR